MKTQKAMYKAEIARFVTEWYRKLDVHASQVELMPMLAKRGLRMKFPEATLVGQAAFEAWYQGVMRIFFDEAHQVRSVKVRIRDARAKVAVVVRWEASRWRPPAARSDRIILDAYQTWEIRRSAATGGPEIVTYSVDRIRYVKGSAKL